MNNCRAKAQRRAEKAHSLVGQDIMPFTHTLIRSRRRSDRSSTGCRSSLSSSIETFFSGAWSSVSDFLDDISEKGEDAVKDLRRKIYFNIEDRDREERRKRARERYGELYSNKLQLTSEQFTNGDKLFVPEYSIDTGTEKNKITTDNDFEKNVYLGVGENNSSKVVKNSFESKGKSFGNVNDNVQRWFSSSNSDSYCSSQASATKICYKRTNSDHLPRKFSKDEADTRLKDTKSLQTLHSKDIMDTFKPQLDSPLVFSEKIVSTNRRKRAESIGRMPYKGTQFSRSPVLDGQRRTMETVEQMVCNISSLQNVGNVSPPQSVGDTSMELSDKTVHIMDNENTLGTINLVIEYIALSNLLKLTVEGIYMRDNVQSINKGSSVFIKVYMTLKDEVKKACSKNARGKHLMFYNEEIYLEIDDPESANLPLLRLVICKRKALFGKFRYKPIAETIFYVNKNEFDGKLELSKFLKVCI